MAPQRVARSVVGHLLAAEVWRGIEELPSDAPFQRTMRAYFMDPHAALPEQLSIFYWPYLTQTVYVAPFISKINTGFQHTFTGAVLKFFPLGFLVAWEATPGPAAPYHLLRDRALPLDTRMPLPIRLSERRSVDFPEAPGDGEATLLHSEVSLVGRPQLTGRQRR